jgi:hypothetical protein
MKALPFFPLMSSQIHTEFPSWIWSLRRAEGMGKEGGLESSWLLLKETASELTESLGWAKI